MATVLHDVRVLDLSRYISGPVCTSVLADMGAEVIRIENPTGAEDREQGPKTPTGDNVRFLMVSRNKRGITLALDHPKGQHLFRQLVGISDIVVENYSPPVKEKLGVTYEELRSIRDDIIVISCSAFGDDGPYRDRLAFDPIIQAESGAMSICGLPDGPPTRSQVPWVDTGTGLYGAIGALLALRHRDQTGEGQLVETALMDTAVSFIGLLGTACEYEVLGQARPRVGNASYYTYADSFRATDGMVLLAVASDAIWRRLVRLIGRPELARDPRFLDDSLRYHNDHLISTFVAPWIEQRSVADVLTTMSEARIPCGKINEVADMIVDPQVQARHLFQKLEVDGIGAVSFPRTAISMSRTPGRLDRPAPRIGEGNDFVYSGLLGLDSDSIRDLRAEGII